MGLRQRGLNMQKLSRILAVIDHPQNARVLLDKAVRLARCFGARVEALVCSAQSAAISS